MTNDGVIAALFRSVPLALCLPLPGVFARLALGVVLATAVTNEQAPLHALVTGVACGLSVGAPIWAARWAGMIVGRVSSARSLDTLYATLAWIVFLAAGGGRMLIDATSRPIASASSYVSLAAQLALPALLALAIVEILAALAERVEGGVELPLEARRVVHATRPLIATLLLLGGLASFAHGVAAAMR